MSFGSHYIDCSLPLENPSIPRRSLVSRVRKACCSIHPTIQKISDYNEFKSLLNTWVDDSNEGSFIEDKKRARRRILSAFWNNRTQLCLNSLNLYTLPPCLERLNLVSLDFSNNKLGLGDSCKNKNIFLGLETIEYLELNKNELTSLTSIDLLPLKKLKSLQLKQNHFSNCDSFPKFSKFPNLMNLDLSFNQISDIHSLDVSNCSELCFLYLTGNCLVDVELNLIGCPKVEWVCLYENRLKTFCYTESMPNDSTIDFNLSNNPMSCN